MRGMKGLVYETSVLDPEEVSIRTTLVLIYCRYICVLFVDTHKKEIEGQRQHTGFNVI